MNLWISVFKLLIMDFGYSKLTYSYVIVEEKFTGVWVVVFSCTRPCWVWGVTLTFARIVALLGMLYKNILQ
jgi:hypothetical protein